MQAKFKPSLRSSIPLPPMSSWPAPDSLGAEQSQRGFFSWDFKLALVLMTSHSIKALKSV